MASEPKYKKLRQDLYALSDLSYRFCQIYAESYKRQIDYGTGEQYATAEVHLVTQIADNPGITSTEIAHTTGRSKSAVSQIITKLESKGLIRRERSPKNLRFSSLYVTPKGLKLSKAHKEYDCNHVTPYLEDYIALFGLEAVQHFYDIMEYQVSSLTDTKSDSQK